MNTQQSFWLGIGILVGLLIWVARMIVREVRDMATAHIAPETEKKKG